jgi:hypothetical protein
LLVHLYTCIHATVLEWYSGNRGHRGEAHGKLLLAGDKQFSRAAKTNHRNRRKRTSTGQLEGACSRSV